VETAALGVSEGLVMIEASFPRFSEDVRTRLAEIATDLDEWEAFLGDYETLFRDRFDAEPDPIPALSLKEKVELVALGAVAYTRQLAWAIVRAVNSDATPSLYLSTRAHFEMTGFLAYLLWRLGQFDGKSLTEAELESYVTRLSLGRRHGTDTLPEELAKSSKWIGVLDMIDAVDRAIPEPALKGHFRDGYEWLSEFCHPNSLSRLSVQKLAGRTMLFERFPQMAARDAGVAIAHASISHIVFLEVHEGVLAWLGKQ
jgi:hypothetical protein